MSWPGDKKRWCAKVLATYLVVFCGIYRDRIESAVKYSKIHTYASSFQATVMDYICPSQTSFIYGSK